MAEEKRKLVQRINVKTGDLEQHYEHPTDKSKSDTLWEVVKTKKEIAEEKLNG